MLIDWIHIRKRVMCAYQNRRPYKQSQFMHVQNFTSAFSNSYFAWLNAISFSFFDDDCQPNRFMRFVLIEIGCDRSRRVLFLPFSHSDCVILAKCLSFFPIFCCFHSVVECGFHVIRKAQLIGNRRMTLACHWCVVNLKCSQQKWYAICWASVAMVPNKKKQKPQQSIGSNVRKLLLAIKPTWSIM